MRKTLAMALKESRQAMRDPLTVFMVLGLPTMLLVLYGFALSFDVDNVRLAVLDRDKSAASRDLVSAFVDSRYFELVADLTPSDDLHRMAEERRARAFLVIPEEYGTELAAGRRGLVQLIVDGADSTTATTILGYANIIVADENATLLRRFLTRGGSAAGPEATAVSAGGGPGSGPVGPSIDYAPRVWYNPELESGHFLVPGLVGVIMMLTAVLSTALSVVKEKELGSMEQLSVAPLRTVHILIGKTLPYLVLSLVATVIVLVAARLLFGVEVRGSDIDLLPPTLLFLLGALGLGLLISSVAESQAVAFQIGVISSLLPSLLLSGFVFPIRSMPEALQLVTYAVPARYYLTVLRGVILKGAGLAPYRTELWSLAAFAVLVLTIASARLARQRI